MDVVVNVGGKIVVDDVSDIGNIQSSGGNGGSNKNGASTVAEELEGTFTLTLSSVTMNRSGGEVLVDEEVGERVGHALGLDEDQGEATGVGVEDVKKNGALVNVLDVLDLLGDVLRGGTDTTNGEEDVVLEEVAGEHLDVAGEGGREHQGLAFLDVGHILAFDDAANLGLETHVKHTISLIQNQVLDVAEGDATSLYEIDQSTGSSHKQITAALDLSELGANIGTTVDDARSDPGSVGELSGLIVDLRNKLTGGGEDQRGGVGLALTTKLSRGIGGDRRRTVDEGLRKDGEEETTSLSGTSLSASHEITAAHDNGDGVLLDGGGDLVVGELDVAAEVLIQRRGGELVDGLGNIVAGSLDRNVVVLLEVDTGVLLGRVVGGTEKLTLDTGVSRTGDVLSVAPLAITRAASSVTTTTTATRVAVEVAAAAITTASTTPAAAAVVVLVGGNVVAPVGLAGAVVLAAEKVSDCC